MQNCNVFFNNFTGWFRCICVFFDKNQVKNYKKSTKTKLAFNRNPDSYRDAKKIRKARKKFVILKF